MCIVTIKNTENNMIIIHSCQIVVYLDCRSKGCSLPWYTVCNNAPSMQNHVHMGEGMLHDMQSPESLQKLVKKG